MIDIQKQISYWRKGAEDNWEVGNHLIDRGNLAEGLFFLHLALEKFLKAHVCRATQDLAPRAHRLERLAELANLEVPDSSLNLLADMNPYNIEGRYPGTTMPLIDKAEADRLVSRAKEVFEWLQRQL